MEALLTCPAYALGLNRNASESAGSEEALVVERAFEPFLISQGSSVYYTGDAYTLLCELADLYHTSHSADWDLEESGRPSAEAYVNAKNFITALPQDWPKPILNVDRDGDFTFEWILAPKLRISLSIGEDAEIAYSWIIQGERSYGVDFLGVDLPASFETQADRVFDAERRFSGLRTHA